jgi:hypothetical protein
LPNRAGRSRHGTPVRSRNRIPEMTVRWSFHRPPCGGSAGSSGLSSSHSGSVSSKRQGMASTEHYGHPSLDFRSFAYDPVGGVRRFVGGCGGVSAVTCAPRVRMRRRCSSWRCYRHCWPVCCGCSGRVSPGRRFGCSVR